ncbi:MAG TPA: TetR family transcriptional regulator [Cyanobacteria bacterium UBA11149]|nr:TetR family transcriptional regulator [Cyanobacteria bacterium UBA11367]HBE58110.1 TetR family transcriptional regulator [Cyanobacteria bacterium UBA11366]HBK64175.1 TetR family transcriptional regulator [Cyanobacteria bacterium UBA11166]HBR77173.1 TetR family transcriptional regulator [Cyanobacteria bacterium UBA11159]HBS71226.1 TetR family transcriptional regulator [Cyanobacteria bacterium UBA11153]HBW88119.1 TetR family transcriptional regulator [Cyanobacteria bacterium UBA11149]HCA9585
MSNSALSNVLLPAVFVAGAVFSVLTVPLALIKSEPVILEVPSVGGLDIPPVEIPPIFDGEHKDIAIPYIGFAIVISVGGGMAAVEVYRRWYQWQESALAEKEQDSSNQKPQELSSEIPPEGLELPEYRPEVSAIALSSLDDPFHSQSIPPEHNILESVEMKMAGDELWLNPEMTIPDGVTLTSVSSPDELPSSIDLVTDDRNLVELDSDGGIVDASLTHLNGGKLYSEQESQPDTVVRELLCSSASYRTANIKILTSRSEYQTCRLELPHLKQRLLTIQVDDEYYSFLRMESTHQGILEILARLKDRFPHTLVTKTEKAFVIWAKVNHPHQA